MKKCDILLEISERKLTEDQANDILIAVLESPEAAKIEELLGFSRVEWTAYGQGASLAEIATWRQFGWPRKCYLCGNEIDIEKFGWWVLDVENGSVLKHLRCPKIAAV